MGKLRVSDALLTSLANPGERRDLRAISPAMQSPAPRLDHTSADDLL
jgi:hypothetical protein